MPRAQTSLCRGRQLLASGAKVMATDFDAKQLADMQTASTALHVHAGDISKEQDVAELFESARKVLRVKLILTEGSKGWRDHAAYSKLLRARPWEGATCLSTMRAFCATGLW